MFLKKIELYGFKSFADKSSIELPSGVTMVIGPNGSGKSNVVDAIRWVLGEQSMKNLRGSKSEDIIFAGTQTRKSVGFAEVNLYIDNASGTLPIEFDEVVITRRIYRSGESEYQLNKTQCRLKDIQQLFYNTGVGKEGYSVIGQGKVEEILNSKSEDRRYMFEEAAGILKYRYSKNEAERKLENTRINLERVNDIIAEIDGRLETLCIQSEKAKKYLNYREELKTKEISLFNFNMQKNNTALDETNEKCEILQAQITESQGKLNEIQELKVKTKEDVELLFKKQEDIQHFIFDSENMIEKINSEKSMLEVQRNNNLANFETLSKEIVELENLIKTNEDEKVNRTNKIELLALNRKKFDEELTEKQAQYDEMYSKLSQKGEEIEKKKECIEAEHEKVVEYRLEVNTLKNEIENNKNNYIKLEKEEKEKIHEKDIKKMEREDVQNVLSEKMNEKRKYDDLLKSINDQQSAYNNKLQAFEQDIQKYTEEYRNKKSRRTFLCEIQKEREGYARAVKEVLLKKDANVLTGVEGSIADLISTPKEYEVAIEMVLGAYLQNIVTLTPEDAKKCIEFLKETKAGRASFLPISTVKGGKLDTNKIKNEKGFIGIASELVKYDKKYEDIVGNLLGKIVIVTDIDAAISIAKKGCAYKIVTLDGDIVSGYGQMTGGSIEKKMSSILGRNVEIDSLEKEIKVIEKKINDLNNKKREFEQSQQSAAGENVADLNESSNKINIECAINSQKIETINNEIESIEKRTTKILEEKKEILEINEKKQVEIDEKNQYIFESEEKTGTLLVQINDYAESSKEEQICINDLKEEITNLKISISSFEESNVSYEEMILMINNEIEKAKVNIEKKDEQKAKILVENEEYIVKKENLEKQIIEINDKKANVDVDIQGVKNEKEEKNKLLDEFDKKVEEILNNTSLLNTDLARLESKKSKIEDEIEELKTRMIEEYEMPLEKLLMQEIEILEPNKVQKEINVLRKNIKELGSINIEAIAEYKESKERFDFLSEQRNDLEATESKVKKLIQEITVVMKEQFRTKFKIINECFGEVFIKLFGGGKAEVILTDEEDILNCGVEIEVQPPGKKLQNMMLLSGGEKALTAIALLFGILKTNPSPFCVLDEIEAALDDINVFRFAQYVKEYADKTQFLIITHRKGTMEIADTLYGVTMQEQGISKLISMKI